MKGNVEIVEYILKMLLDDKWGVHAELVAFSELYNVQIQVFDSFGLWDTITRISAVEGEIWLECYFLKIIKIVWQLKAMKMILL